MQCFGRCHTFWNVMVWCGSLCVGGNKILFIVYICPCSIGSLTHCVTLKKLLLAPEEPLLHHVFMWTPPPSVVITKMRGAKGSWSKHWIITLVLSHYYYKSIQLWSLWTSVHKRAPCKQTIFSAFLKQELYYNTSHIQHNVESTFQGLLFKTSASATC